VVDPAPGVQDAASLFLPAAEDPLDERDEVAGSVRDDPEVTVW